jgi:hypothetical protein
MILRQARLHIRIEKSQHNPIRDSHGFFGQTKTAVAGTRVYNVGNVNLR